MSEQKQKAPAKPRGERRAADVVAAERIGALSIEGIEKLAVALVKESPRTAEFLANSITAVLAPAGAGARS